MNAIFTKAFTPHNNEFLALSFEVNWTKPLEASGKPVGGSLASLFVSKWCILACTYVV